MKGLEGLARGMYGRRCFIAFGSGSGAKAIQVCIVMVRTEESLLRYPGSSLEDCSY